MAMNKLPNRKQTKDGAVNVKASTFLMDIYYNNLLARIYCSDLLIATTFSCNLLNKHWNPMVLYQFLTKNIKPLWMDTWDMIKLINQLSQLPRMLGAGTSRTSERDTAFQHFVFTSFFWSILTTLGVKS